MRACLLLPLLSLSCATAPPRAPDRSPALTAALLKRVKPGGQNHLHCRRLFFYASAFAPPAGARLDLVQAAALLHDSTKEDGSGAPKQRFCTHGAQGADYARQTLVALGEPVEDAERVAAAIREHMGPCGEDPERHRPRFMSRFCGGPYPAPSTAEARVLYDIDMLDLMTVDGIGKVVEFRQTRPEFGKESLRESARDGADSAWASVVEARQTLLTPAAIACDDALVAHSRGFLDGLDWSAVRDVGAFHQAVTTYVGAHPLPACLPSVPPCAAGDPTCG